ncbi:MAG: tRNA threonylcarbamoyladenosine dehydratase [Ruminococcaceae bacterium]|nr:tRNA threonylcarbamoyladenosine dehydratase [Oscillospiraceae bacterium]
MNNKNFSEEESRTVRVIGAKAQDKLRQARVAVFGVGGVGGHVCEALARAGVGAIDIFDRDCVSLSNINRQIIALHSTVGKPKVEVMRERILDINPHCRVTANQVFYLPDNAEKFDLSAYDFIADAVDTVAAKIELAVRATDKNVPIVSAMGAGNKLSPDRFCVTDIYKTTTDPLARVMRRELKARGIKKLRVVCSDEPPISPHPDSIEDGSAVPGSLSFVPSVMGLIMAGEIIKELIE